MQTTIETPEEKALIEALEKGELYRIEGEEFRQMKESLQKAAEKTFERNYRSRMKDTKGVRDA